MQTEATGTISTESNNLNSGIGLNEAAESSAFLEALGELPEQDEEVEITSDEELESDESEEDLEEEQDVEDSEEELDDTEESEDEGEEAGDDTEEFYVVKIDGEELEVSEDELLSGYQRQRDYTRKTQELADQRKTLEAEINSLREERTKYVKSLELSLEEESKELEKYNDIDWATLRKEDPNQFLLLHHEMSEVRQKISDKKAAREEALSKVDTSTSKLEEERLAREATRVKELVEGWEGEGHQQLVSTLREQATKEGFTDEDGDLFKSAMVIKLLQKANKYDALERKKETVVKKKVARKVPKVIKSGNKSDTADTKRRANSQKQMERLKQTGNLKDSVALFEQYL